MGIFRDTRHDLAREHGVHECGCPKCFTACEVDVARWPAMCRYCAAAAGHPCHTGSRRPTRTHYRRYDLKRDGPYYARDPVAV